MTSKVVCMCVLAGTVFGCTTPRAASVRYAGAAVGELRPAIPPQDEARGHVGTTNTFATLVLDARRDQAGAVYLQYLKALLADDLETVSTLLDTSVSVMDSGMLEQRAQSVMLSMMHGMQGQVDPSPVAALAPELRTKVRAFAELSPREQADTMGTVTRPGDYIVEPDEPALGTGPLGWVFRQIKVRWVNGEPKIVAVQWNVRSVMR